VGSPRRIETDVAALYHLNSNNSRHRTVDFDVAEDSRPLRFRTYPGSLRVSLPGKDFELPMSLGEALRARHSTRSFRPESLPLEAFGRLLFCSYGVRGKKKIEGEWCYDRPSPSAGGLYPLEFYAACQNVGGLRDGIYHYDACAHELELQKTGLFHLEIAGMMIGQDMVRDVNIVLLIAANFRRTMWKYGQRGYRYIFLDAGHAAQNVYLVATALNLGVVSIGGFFDDELSSLVGLPGSEERVIYAVCVGSKQQANGHTRF
jgi:SagB-type dehydrogenase family enzyme